MAVPAESEPVLSASFSFRDPMLFRARAKLVRDRLLLTGWHFRGRYSREIPIAQIVHVDAKDGHGLVLWLVDGEVVRIKIDHPEIWRAALSRKRDEQDQQTNL